MHKAGFRTALVYVAPPPPAPAPPASAAPAQLASLTLREAASQLADALYAAER